jgi:hypothetical protein
MAFAVLLVVIMVATGGAAVASAHATPGDAFYQFKIHITEPMQTALAITTEAKAEVALQHVEERLEEADGLANAGKLDESTLLALEDKLESRSAQVRERIAKLEEKGKTDKALDLASRFEASLETHRRILAKLASNGGDDHKSEAFVKIEQTVNDEHTSAVEVRNNIEARSNSTTAVVNSNGNTNISVNTNTSNSNISREDALKKVAQTRYDAAAKTIDDAETQIKNSETKLGAEAVVKAKATLAQAKEALAKAKTSLDSGKYQDSIKQSVEAFKLAIEARVMAQVQFRLNLPKIDFDNQADFEARLKEQIKGSSTNSGSSSHVEIHNEVNTIINGTRVK